MIHFFTSNLPLVSLCLCVLFFGYNHQDTKTLRKENKEGKLNNLTIGLVVLPICAGKQARCLHYFIDFSFLCALCAFVVHFISPSTNSLLFLGKKTGFTNIECGDRLRHLTDQLKCLPSQRSRQRRQLFLVLWDNLLS